MPSTPSEDLSPEIASALLERLSKVQEARRRQRLFYRLFVQALRSVLSRTWWSFGVGVVFGALTQP